MSVGSKYREKEVVFPYRTGLKDARFLLDDIHQSHCGTEPKGLGYENFINIYYHYYGCGYYLF